MKKIELKSQELASEIIGLYNQKLEELSISYQSIDVITSFGKTHVIITGDIKNPPLVLLHGTNGSAPIALDLFPNLSKKYCVYAIDLLGQPNKSEANRLNMKNEEYGKWLQELVLYFDLNNVTLVGFSFGGFIALKSMLLRESWVKAAHLVAPVFIVNGSVIKQLIKVFMPIRKFVKTRNNKYTDKIIGELFSEPDSYSRTIIPLAFEQYGIDLDPLPVISKKQAKCVKSPVSFYAAEDDLLFPGSKLINRAKKIFPNIQHVVLFKETKHVPFKSQFEEVEQYILSAI